MPRRPLIPLITVLAVLGTGCRESQTNDVADTSADAVRANAAAVNAKASKGFDMPDAIAGHMTLTDAEIFFLPCGRLDDPQKLEDATGGEAIRLLRAAKGPAGGLMTLVRLESNRLVQIRFASTERTSCKDLPPAVTAEAMGNEPFWGVRIDGDLATYRTPYNLKGIVYQGGKWTRTDSTHWRFVAQRTGDGDNEIVVELAEGRCMDSMAASVFPMSATVTRGDSTFKGCALEGRGSFAGSVDSVPKAPTTSPRARADSSLHGTAWRLSELNGEPVLENVKATLEFMPGGKVSGNSSCNRFSGAVDVVADSIRFGALVSTRMACPDAIMRQESAYLEALTNAERYTREGNSMVVHQKGSAKPLRFEPL